MSGLGHSPMPFHNQDSNNTEGGGSNHSAGELEPSPEKPVTSARTPTERKRKRKTTAASATGGPTTATASPGLMAASDLVEGHKPNKTISEYFPKRAPASPVRGGTKSPLSFGSIYPQSPKTTPYSTAGAGATSGNANNGPPPTSFGPDFFGAAGTQTPLGKPCKTIQTDVTMAELTKKASDLEGRDNRIDELQRMNEELTRHLTTRNKDLDTSKNTINKCLNVVKELLIEKSRIERKDARAKCMQNRLRLGQFVTQRVGATFQENWTDGYAFQVALAVNHKLSFSRYYSSINCRS